ncbi:MAG TPA: universal stress protein [Actinomycetota bacterium]|nr:universal stress protein [Actinomycetota bacterium]
MPYRKIVVGTDGSDSAARAVNHAGWLARTLDAELNVIHAYDESETETESKSVGSSVLRDACGGLEDLDPKAHLRRGNAVGTLISLAEEEGADLIVVGNRGMGKRQVLVGSVPSRVAPRTPCDLLIAHTTGTRAEGEYGRVLIATDGSPTASRAAFTGAALARAVGVPAALLYVGDEARGGDIVNRTAEEAGATSAERITASGDPAEEIVRVAEDAACDLIVVGNKGMVGARRFLTSVPSRVARRARCHVLLVKTT